MTWDTLFGTDILKFQNVCSNISLFFKMILSFSWRNTWIMYGRFGYQFDGVYVLLYI